MRRLPALLLLIALLLLAACMPIQPAADAPAAAPAAESASESATSAALPVDPAVRSGVLENGLTWFIRPNAEPAQRAELWLAVNAGSNQEEDDQQGLAHFLEHMLFNGTVSYPSNELIAFLESVGMEFGPDVNAYTSFEETVYTLQVPTDDEEVLAQALHVLREWAGDALIDPAEVEKERGVVIEEWRLRFLNAQGRITDELIGAILGGSRYAERLPIGNMEIVRSAPPETVRAFYERWYRPDNMAVIAVGDFADLDALQARIEEEFGSLVNPAEPIEKETYTVPDYGETNVAIVSDPELTSTEVQVIFKQDPERTLTSDDMRSGLVAQTALQVLNYRFTEITQGANPPFLFAAGGLSAYVRAADISYLYAALEPGTAETGLTVLMTEAERLRRFGVTQSEFDRAVADTLRAFESAADEAQNIAHSSHADALLYQFLVGDPAVSAEELYAQAQALFPTITLEEVNAAASEIFPTANRVVLFSAPEEADVALPTSEALLAAVAAAEAAELEAPEEAAAAGPLLAQPPAAAEIVSTETIDEIGVTVVTFANGLALWMKPTDFKDDEVLFELVSPGGISAVEDEEAAEAAWIASIIGASGVGELDQTALQRALTGITAYASPYIDETTEGISAGASPQDLETLFQLVYLYATQARSDENALALFQRQVDSFLSERSNQPQSLLEDRQLEIQCGADNPRCSYLDALAEVAGFDLAQATEVYRSRFGDFGDGTALLVGSFDVDEATALAQQYLGTLPADGRSESWADRMPPLPATPIGEDLFKGIDASSYVMMSWTAPFTPTVESRVAARALESVLNVLITDELREELGGIYGAGVSVGMESVPNGEFNLAISFTAEPTRAVEMVGAVEQILVQVRDEGPDDAIMERARQPLITDHETNLELNEGWLAWLYRYVVTGEGPATDVLRVDEALAAVTPAEVQALAQQVLPADGVVRLTLYPADFEVAP